MALPPGRARLSTKPPPTGSVAFTNTIGTVRVACYNAPTICTPTPKMTVRPLPEITPQRLDCLAGVISGDDYECPAMEP